MLATAGCGSESPPEATDVDAYWDALSAGGDARAQQCGWLSDRYGLAWQIVPTFYQEVAEDPDPERWDRVMEATLEMKKIDVAALKRAYDGGA